MRLSRLCKDLREGCSRQRSVKSKTLSWKPAWHICGKDRGQCGWSTVNIGCVREMIEMDMEAKTMPDNLALRDIIKIFFFLNLTLGEL